MKSNDYWRRREEEALKHYISDEKEFDKRIKQIHTDMLDNCQREIEAFYGKYADKEGISIAEAKKRVSKLDIAAYERKAKRYVKDKDFSARANEEMRLYNAAMKINRLEMLKANIGLELIAGTDELEKFMSGVLQGRTEEELARQAGILGKTVKNNAQKAHAIVNASFHNATFSDRVWMYQDLMKAELSKLLQSGMIQGKNPRLLARDLTKLFGTSTFNAERLIRTELARVQTEAQKQSYTESDVEEYEFIANSGCCSHCQDLDGKHFKVSKMMPGENAPPLHPHCRCSTAEYVDRKNFDAWLDYVSKGGTMELAEWNAAQTKNNLTNSSKSGIISARNINDRNMSNNLRRSALHILTDEEIASVKSDAESLNIPLKILRFNEGSSTAFDEELGIITVRGDVMPDLNSRNVRDRLSQKAVLAHEYYGHYKNHPSAFRIGDWRDEFRASFCAALNAPNLSDEERRMLMLDAYDRAKEAGVKVTYNKAARRVIFGEDE